MQHELKIGRVNNTVLISINGRAVGLSWSFAQAFARALRRIGEDCQSYAEYARRTGDLTRETHDQETIGEIKLQAAGPAVVAELQGTRWFECNYRTVPMIVTGVAGVAALLEEEDKAQQMITDEALLLRTGLPVGLAYNRQIKKEAWKSAEDVKFDGMVEPQAIFYPPTIIQHPPVSQV